ncbi:alpha/beta fold hydrolase [Candidatus Thiothrix sp. Deng01]|uniref:Alpha/beta fold hydrolase n=1 Tax=Candidatus Thiothrix phosphatis TaxID=3112415 RepID=A0ABU6D3A8_9GAMM|nr:alpha/beta fold hydrolase [Candidatus Thiothrix sp. Deng01]MEB4593495.1 alpha/beta fold hydrolase [Candidatus Thiothrix sp. Deng01]
MKIRSLIILAIGLLVFPVSLWAKTTVLIHGFQGNGMSWRMDGVTPALQQNGWVDGGNFIPTPQGPYDPVSPQGKPERIFYTVELPSHAPIMAQARMLDAYLQRIYALRQEPLTLVGHSAGGLVARAWLVAVRSVPVETLVTIATPNIGTPTADMACLANDTPLSMFAGAIMGMGQWVDGTDDLYRDLRTEKPGRFLYWLNHQPHPPIRYVSIVRDNQLRPDRYDFVVPETSQDMNKVFALRGQSEYWAVKGSHFLGVPDGYALAMALSRP